MSRRPDIWSVARPGSEARADLPRERAVGRRRSDKPLCWTPQLFLAQHAWIGYAFYDEVLCRFPELDRVFGTVGRGTTSTDNTPMGMVNTTVTLKPREQ
ncbi:MAG: hypothetical protein HOP16_11815 [Acidobacteria bacterium]|nr:hypothetical protein [Acidobacteriota bacterium]